VTVNPRELDSLSLASLCARDTQATVLWSEFVRRFTPKIRQFIWGTLRQSLGADVSLGEVTVLLGGTSENDLLQSTIVRLIEDDCAALRRFSGTSENDLLAYLAVISRSVVRGFLRRQSSLKRSSKAPVPRMEFMEQSYSPVLREGMPQTEREVLAREVARLSKRAIDSLSGESSRRDWLIFQLYYREDLSSTQIAQCRGIGLSKTGVESVLERYRERVRTIVSVNHSEAAV